jgi:hypothetical protein
MQRRLNNSLRIKINKIILMLNSQLFPKFIKVQLQLSIPMQYPAELQTDVIFDAVPLQTNI